MMVISGVWQNLRSEIVPLFDLLGEEAKQSERTPRPVVELSLYDAMDETSDLITIAMIHDGAVVGFWLAFLCRHPHHQDKLACAADLVFIKKEHRGGSAFVEALRLLKSTAQDRGASVLYVHSPVGHDFGPILLRNGLQPVETQYSVWF